MRSFVSPQAITAALPKLRAATPPAIQIGAYANGFRQTTSDWLAASAASHSCGGVVFFGLKFNMLFRIHTYPFGICYSSCNESIENMNHQYLVNLISVPQLEYHIAARHVPDS